jgi:hypothetical protein
MLNSLQVALSSLNIDAASICETSNITKAQSDVARPCGLRLPEDEAYLKVAVSAIYLRSIVMHYGC